MLFKKVGYVFASEHRFDIGPGATLDQNPAQRVAIIGPVGQQGLAGADTVQHIGGASAIMGLAFREFQREWIAVGIDHRVDFGSQSAA